ncbi:MAG: 30S ribosomal protein S20 [Deltaproteobacteria bacterium]|nr:30S ribosomal protein S20 [Deltaproteobacteria bacterium]
MANHPSAEKRHRQNIKRRTRNAARRSKVRSAVRKLEQALANKDREAGQDLLQKAISSISKARSKGIFHKRTAARKVSRLSRKVARTFQ